MIIHNPKISGSLQFPSDENGNLIALQVQNGTLETITLNSSGVDQGIQPAVNYSGSFTGSFVGDGSSLTGVSAINIDALSSLGGATVAQGDNLVVSDAGTEKKVTFSNLEDSIFANVSGDISIAAGGDVTLGKDGVISGSAQISALGYSTTDNELTTEEVQDIAGGMVSGNTETGITVTYQDGDGTIDFVVASQTDENFTTADHSKLDGIEASADVTDAANVLSSLPSGVISGSAQVSIDSSQISDVAAFSQSGTYANLRAQSTTKGDVGLGNVDNTSDANKPVSTAQQTEIDTKADIASPSLTGNPTAPTQADNDNSTKIATTAYVQREVSDLLGGAPAAFDTLLEISASIANGDSDVVALTTTVGGKLQKDQNLSDLTNASTARTNLGVDAAGTDNSTDVTLVTTSHDYLGISGQAITLGTIQNNDLANSSITIDGSAISLGGSVTTLQLGTTSSTALAGDTTTISGGQASSITTNSAKVGYTDALVKSKLDTEEVLSGSITSADIDDVAAFSQSGTYSGLRAQSTTAGDVGLGNVTNESKGTMFTSPTFTGTPVSTTPSSNDDSTKIATTAYVQQELTDLVGTAGSTLDTLGELSASLSDDSGSLASLVTTVGTKLAKSSNLSDLADAGTARTNLGVDVAGTDNSTDVTLGNTNYLSISGQAITGGTVPIGSGGTGATSAGAARTALGVDAAGTDNSTEVTVAGNTYISLSGQEITAGTVDISSHTNLAVSDTTEVNMILSGDTLSAELIGGVVSGSSQITSIGNSQLSNSSITIDGSAISLGGSISTNNTQLSTEQVQDIVGGMLGGTETGITVTYQDGTGDIDFVVASQTDENFTTADHSKLDGIEAGAEVNRTAAETRTLIGTGNSGIVPAAGSSGEFLKHDGTFGTPSYTTNTNTQLTQEQVEDFVGGMLDGTETGISVGYDDTNGNIDFVVASQTDENFTTADHSKLDGIEASANNYVLPTNLAGDDIDIDTTALTGATVISDLDINITTNTSGLVTDANGSVSTRTLTKSDIGLGNVTNESKSTMFASPTFTGTTVAPTPSSDDNSTKIATTAYVQGELTGLIGGAPAAFDTLLEISASIANGDSDVVSLTSVVGGKLQKDQNLSDLSNASTARTNLGVDAAGTVNYVLPTNLAGDDISVDTGALTGATVISDLDFNITTNTSGLVTDANGSVSTRTLTAGNLGLGSGDDVTFGTVRVDDATTSTSKTTGALIVDGGVGISGALNVGGDVVAYASSDERLKDNIELISNPIERVQALKGVTWDWNSNADELQQSLPNVGVIAQDVEKVLPQLVTDRDNGFKGVDYAKLTGLLIEAVKDQQKQIDELKSKLS